MKISICDDEELFLKKMKYYKKTAILLLSVLLVICVLIWLCINIHTEPVSSEIDHAEAIEAVNEMEVRISAEDCQKFQYVCYDWLNNTDGKLHEDYILDKPFLSKQSNKYIIELNKIGFKGEPCSLNISGNEVGVKFIMGNITSENCKNNFYCQWAEYGICFFYSDPSPYIDEKINRSGMVPRSVSYIHRLNYNTYSYLICYDPIP